MDTAAQNTEKSTLDSPHSPDCMDAVSATPESVGSPEMTPPSSVEPSRPESAGSDPALHKPDDIPTCEVTFIPDKPAPDQPGPAARLFNALSWAGLPVLLLLTVAMTAAGLWKGREPWLADEVRQADIYTRFLGSDGLILNFNGTTGDSAPLYFWFLKLLDSIPGVDAPLLFPIGSVLSALLFMMAIWILARATGHDRRMAFASGLLVLSSLFLAVPAGYPGEELAFAGLITLSLICLYRGWIKISAPLWLTLGFILAGLASLIKGPFALVLPVVVSILFLFWRGTPGRLNGRDGLLGFALMLILPLVWLAAVYFQGQTGQVQEILSAQTLGHRQVEPSAWWYYLAALPLLCLPWTLLVLFVNWWGTLKAVPAGWKQRRENGGRGWLWLIVLSGLGLLSIPGGKSVFCLLPLLPALAVLGGRSLLALTPRRSRLFFALLAVLFALTGFALILAEGIPFLMPHIPEGWATAWNTKIPAFFHACLDHAQGLAIMGAVLVVLAVSLLIVTRRSFPGGALLITTIGMVLLVQPWTLKVLPSLEVMFSPRAQAEVMAQYIVQAYAPASWEVSPGIHTYDLNRILTKEARPASTVTVLDSRTALDAFLQQHPRAIVAMPEKIWQDQPIAGLSVVHRKWLGYESVVLAVQDRFAYAPMGQPLQDAPPEPEEIPSVPAPGEPAIHEPAGMTEGMPTVPVPNPLQTPLPSGTSDQSPALPAPSVPMPEASVDPIPSGLPVELPAIPATPPASVPSVAVPNHAVDEAEGQPVQDRTETGW